jgi:hypothetical protein
MTFKQILLASCALVISATAATAQVPSYVPTDGLVGWWPFNGNANDESGNGNDGVVNGATLTVDRNEIANAAFYFNGSSDFITISNTVMTQVVGSYCVSFWVKNNDASNQFNGHEVLSDRDAGSYKYRFRLNFSISQPQFVSDISYIDCFESDQNWNIVYSEVPELNNWEQYVINYSADSQTFSAYKNGILIQTLNNVSLVTGSRQINIGRTIAPAYVEGTSYFNGSVDDIAIYNRALTEQEIQNLYTGTTTTVDTGNGAAPLPQGIPYQAAARDVQGQVIADAPVNVRFTLHEGAADGAASYAETHALTTNSVGLFNTVFGSGTPEQSAFDSINWAATTKFLQVEIDLGEGYVDMGTTQLLSVPYALRSDEAARVKNAGLPVFNDNAAALAGGLVAGEMYRTSAGVLMVAY